MNKPMPQTPPPIPDKAELFCGDCYKWKHREAIVASKWVVARNKQARYICRTCYEKQRAKTAC